MKQKSAVFCSRWGRPAVTVSMADPEFKKNIHVILWAGQSDDRDHKQHSHSGRNPKLCLDCPVSGEVNHCCISGDFSFVLVKSNLSYLYIPVLQQRWWGEYTAHTGELWKPSAPIRSYTWCTGFLPGSLQKNDRKSRTIDSVSLKCLNQTCWWLAKSACGPTSGQTGHIQRNQRFPPKPGGREGARGRKNNPTSNLFTLNDIPVNSSLSKRSVSVTPLLYFLCSLSCCASAPPAVPQSQT